MGEVGVLPLDLAVIRKDVRRIAAMLQVGTKVTYEPSGKHLRNHSNVLWCSRLVPLGSQQKSVEQTEGEMLQTRRRVSHPTGLGSHARHSPYKHKLTRSISTERPNEMSKSTTETTAPKRLPPLNRKPPTLRHYNTPDETVLTEMVRKRKTERLNALGDKVSKSDIDAFRLDKARNDSHPLKNARSKSLHHLPAIEESNPHVSANHERRSAWERNENIVKPKEAHHVRVPADNPHESKREKSFKRQDSESSTQLPSLTENQPQMKYKHGEIPKPKKSKEKPKKTKSRTVKLKLPRIDRDSTVNDSADEEDRNGTNSDHTSIESDEDDSLIGFINSSNRDVLSEDYSGICKECQLPSDVHSDQCSKRNETGMGEDATTQNGNSTNSGEAGTVKVPSPDLMAERMNKLKSVLDRIGEMKEKQNSLLEADDKSAIVTFTLDPLDDSKYGAHRTKDKILFPNGVKEAYLKALSTSRAMRSWDMFNRTSRAFVFSYYEPIRNGHGLDTDIEPKKKKVPTATLR